MVNQLRHWRIIIRVVITVSILIYLGFKLDWAGLEILLMQSDPVWLLIACFLLGISFLLASIRWWLLLKVQEFSVPFKAVTALTFIGQFFNVLLLGTTGGDLIKLLYVLKYTPYRKTPATVSIIMDRAIGLFILVCCALAALPWQFRFLMQREETRDMVYVLLILFGFILGVTLSLALIPFQRLPFSFRQLWRKIPRRDIIESLIAGFRQHGRSRRLTFEAMACGLAICLTVFTVGYCIALAIHLDVTYMQILTILAIVTCVISLPISIGGHGVREGMFVIMFSVFGIITIDKQTGVGQEPAVLFSILFFALFLVWSLVGGLVYLTFNTSITKIDPQPH
jgi:glycosyltransferase 2 family protein